MQRTQDAASPGVKPLKPDDSIRLLEWSTSSLCRRNPHRELSIIRNQDDPITAPRRTTTYSAATDGRRPPGNASARSIVRPRSRWACCSTARYRKGRQRRSLDDRQTSRASGRNAPPTARLQRLYRLPVCQRRVSRNIHSRRRSITQLHAEGR